LIKLSAITSLIFGNYVKEYNLLKALNAPAAPAAAPVVVTPPAAAPAL